jgi:hypothetical protein
MVMTCWAAAVPASSSAAAATGVEWNRVAIVMPLSAMAGKAPEVHGCTRTGIRLASLREHYLDQVRRVFLSRRR